MDSHSFFAVRPIGRVHSALTDRHLAPKQGSEGAPDARLEIFPAFADGLQGILPGMAVFVLTWLHEANRATLLVHPRDDERRPLTGVFGTRSADRPNPVGLHRVTVLDVRPDGWLHVSGLEAVDGTPVVDLKPVLHGSGEA
jgi:tRNA-Thr(GGU) m(6)t(6)A37 methyltransferase TsaA